MTMEKLEIEALASRAYHEQPTASDVLSPVDVGGIAMAVNLILHKPERATYKLLPSYISAPPVPAKALLSDCLTERQRRFEVAHRLGHHFLHQTTTAPTVIYCQPQYASSVLCAEASIFAKELLLPAFALKKAVAEGQDATSISYTFEVTLHLAEERLQELKL